jgi:carboxylesterase type B
MYAEMKSTLFVSTALVCGGIANATPRSFNVKQQVTYNGLERNGIEIFLNVKYGRDTSGENRFKPPRAYIPTPGSNISATSYGPACPQSLEAFPPFGLTVVISMSEDCLNLNVARPKGTSAEDKLPVLVFIHGGSFWEGSNQEITNAPDGMILESVKNGLPVMHVGLNYRLGSMHLTECLSCLMIQQY